MKLIEVDWKPPNRALRQFAALCLLGGAVAGTLLYLSDPRSLTPRIVWAVAAAAGVAGLLVPPWIRPLYVLLMAVSLPIGMVVSTVLLSAIFYLVMTPIGRIARWAGYDPMARRFDRSAASYWVRRSTATDVKRYFRQY